MRCAWRNVDLAFGLGNISDLNSFKSQVKSSLVWPLSAYLKNKQRGKAVLPFRGHARTYLKRLLFTSPSMRKLSLCQTILIGVKKCAPKMPATQIRKNCDACIGRYTQAPRQPRSVIDVVVRQGRFILRGFDFTTPESQSDFSLRSNLERTRSEFGSYGEAVERFGLTQSVTVHEGQTVTESGVAPVPFQDFIEDLGITETLYDPDADLFTDLTPCNYEVKQSISLKREVVGLAEPLKVRCITLSHWWESPLWSSFQRSAMKFLRRKPYVASGKELPPSFFDPFAKKITELESRTGLPFTIISDDGDAATDSICLDLSNESIRSFIPKELRELYDHCSGVTGYCAVRVKDAKKPDAPWFQQSNSQLMGDRLSFIKLTVIHSSFKIVFLRRYMRVLGLKQQDIERMFIVNGDDGVIAIPTCLVQDYLVWMDKLWNINRMKTQNSRRVFSINSRLFKVGTNSVKEVPFMRWNLISRTDRNGGRIINPQVWNELSQSATGLVEQQTLWDYFHREWAGTLKFLTKRKGNNYFLPTLVGGLGLEPQPGIDYSITSRQKLAVELVVRKLDREGPAPYYMTRTVPLINHLKGVTQEIDRTLRTGVIRGNDPGSKIEFQGTARVKGITKETKLYTKSLPNGNSEYPIRPGDFPQLIYGKLPIRPYSLTKKLLNFEGYFRERFRLCL